MKYFLSLFAIMIILASCDLDQCEQTITYTKAVGIYGDLDEFRSSDIVKGIQPIEKPGKIYISESLIMIGEKGKGIHVIDNTNPANPHNISFLEIPGNYEMFVKDDYIYANSYYDMVKINIEDINNIHVSDRVEEAFEAKYKRFDNTTLIGFEKSLVTEETSCDGQFTDGEIYFFDDQDVLLEESAIPTSFVSNGTTIGTANRMAMIDNNLFTINRTDLYVFDATGNTLAKHPTVESQQYIGWNMETIYAQDDLLFTGSQNGMEIRKFANDEISYEGGFFHATGCDPVLPTSQGIAYITLRSGDECPGDVNNVSVVDFSRISLPVLTQEIEMTSPYGMALIGDRLYVGEGENGLKVFDASQRAQLSEIESVTNVSAYDIMQHPTRTDLILLASESGLVQYEISADQDFTALSTISF